MSEDETARLFVAAIPTPSVIEALGAMRRPDIQGVRWTKPDQWHVTLRFLGQAPVGEAVAAFNALEAPTATAQVGPRVRRLGRGIAVIPVEGLDDLAAAVVAATAAVGEPPDERDFLGHITVARSRRAIPRSALGSELSAEFDVEEVFLVRSQLDHDGPHYETLSARDLS